MRKIEKDMIAAIREGKDFSSGNTAVRIYRTLDEKATVARIQVLLHGKEIASFLPRLDGIHVLLSDGGYRSATTKSRLNAITQAFGAPSVYQKGGQWFISPDVPWHSGETYSFVAPEFGASQNFNLGKKG